MVEAVNILFADLRGNGFAWDGIIEIILVQFIVLAHRVHFQAVFHVGRKIAVRVHDVPAEHGGNHGFQITLRNKVAIQNGRPGELQRSTQQRKQNGRIFQGVRIGVKQIILNDL